LQVAEIFEGRGEIAHLRSEVGGSLVLIQQVQPEQNHGGGDTDREGSAGRAPDLAVSGGQADTAYDAVDRGDQAGQVNSIVVHQPAAQPWVSPINGGHPQLRLIAESGMAARHHAHSPYRANRAGLVHDTSGS
jgi:hypothetical protein